jgi:hypothetical protein
VSRQQELPFEPTPEACPWCGQPWYVELLEYWPEDRAFTIDACCEGTYNEAVDSMRRWTPADWQEWFASEAGAYVRSAGTHLDGQHHFTLDFGVHLVPTTTFREVDAGRRPLGALTYAEVREYVRRYHRHEPGTAPACYWAYAIYNGAPGPGPAYGRWTQGRVVGASWEPPRIVPEVRRVRRAGPGQTGQGMPENLAAFPRNLVGVAIVGAPSSPATGRREKAGGPRVAEVSRVALDHSMAPHLTWKASSLVYQAAWEEACRRGFAAVQTFTRRDDETGMSLRYARYKPVAEGKGGQRSGRKKRDAAAAQPKVRWERRCPPPPGAGP